MEQRTKDCGAWKQKHAQLEQKNKHMKLLIDKTNAVITVQQVSL